MPAPLRALAFDATLPASLADAADADPAVRRARYLLRRMHAELSTLDVRAISKAERRAFHLLLGHLAAGFLPEARGTA